MKIGDINIENPVILAPMAAVSDLPFRNLVLNYGAEEFRPSLAVSEMVASNAQIRDKSKLRVPQDFSQTIVQIFGNDPQTMAESAKINEGLGARIIDINMGCPAGKIIKNGCGSDLMRTPEKARQIVSSVVKAVRIPITVKIRAGWGEDSKNAPEFAKMLEGEGASMITVHGRTRSQLFTGQVDLDIIAKVKRAVKVPVVGNGDICTPEDARQMLDRTGVDGVMIGRGAYGKPWLLSHIVAFLKTGNLHDEPTVPERRDLLLKHAQMMIDFYGEKLGVLHTRKHAAWYAKGLHGAAEFRQKINTATSWAEQERLILVSFRG